MKPIDNLIPLVLPDIATDREVSKHLGITPRTVQRLLRHGVIPGKKLANRWFISREALLLVLDGPEVGEAP